MVFKFTIVNDAFFLFNKPSGLMFLRFVDHHVQLFPMFASHRSNDAMFAMYRSSLMLIWELRIAPSKEKQRWKAAREDDYSDDNEFIQDIQDSR